MASPPSYPPPENFRLVCSFQRQSTERPHIFDQDDSPPLLLLLFFRTMLFELFGVCQTAGDADGHLKLLFGIGGLAWPSWPAATSTFCSVERVGDVESGKAAGGEAAADRARDAWRTCARRKMMASPDTRNTLERI